MTDEKPTPPRRRRPSEPAPEMPSGWRTSRRGSKAGKQARRDLKRYERKEKVVRAAERTKRTTRDIVYLGALGVTAFVGVILLAYLLVLGVNGIARWNAQRAADAENTPEALEEQARDNLLLIGLQDGRAAGFLALRLDVDQEQIYGIAIPDGAFIEVPGQGFERIGDSYAAGSDVSLAAVSNFFNVPFTRYAVVDYETYQTALTEQSLVGAGDAVTDTNLSDEEKERWYAAFEETPSENVALVPLPVKPINLGNQTYFEPQRSEVADLLESWWGVTMTDTAEVTRVIVYNGSGSPGIAGEAAQQLIRSGFRVVDTKNADTFDYESTQIVVQNGDPAEGERAAEVLGVGEVTEVPADQQVADLIVIVGKDYQPPAPE